MNKIPEDLLKHFINRDGFCYPEWDEIFSLTESMSLSEPEGQMLWRQMTIVWLGRVRECLGDAYKIFETRNFFIVAYPAQKPLRDYFVFIEKMRTNLLQGLGDAACVDGHGKHVVLIFDRNEDYFAYLAPCYSEGEHPASGGIFLRGNGYQHIAIPYDADCFLKTMAHEFTHNCLSHLPIPRWLNEALAMRSEVAYGYGSASSLDQETCQKHRRYWNSATIQDFWQGRSWSQPGDSFELSYSLARVILKTIEGEIRPRKESLFAFIKEAHRRDAGNEAAIRHLHVGLGDLASDFLGDGNWSPVADTPQNTTQAAAGNS